MKKSAEIIMHEYQVRKTKKQKQAFMQWLSEHLSAYGYHMREDQYSKQGSNLIVGDVQSAEVILTAHYDTQPNFLFPVIMGFSNWFSFCISQIIVVLPLLAFAVLLKVLATQLWGNSVGYWLAGACCIVYLAQTLFGIPNRHTANDNTSGVATLISILEELPEEDRHKVCVVFFDQEELGLIGSQKFYKKYKAHVRHKPLINFDCVGDGQTLTFVMKKKFRNSAYSELLQEASGKITVQTEKKVRFANALGTIYMSDQQSFPCGVGVVAAKKTPVFGYYINRLHSRLDTKCDSDNIQLLTDTMLQFIRETSVHQDA